MTATAFRFRPVRLALAGAFCLAATGLAPRVRAAAPTVEVFVAAWCGYCHALQRDLDQRGIPYARRDIEADPSARRAYEALGVSGLPVTRIGDTVIEGYDLPAILRAIDAAGPAPRRRAPSTEVPQELTAR